MAAKERIDVLVVERGLAETRAKAQALILAGQVVVDDQRIDKPGSRVPLEAEIRLKGEVNPYVSRGGLKLKAALDHFPIELRDRIGMDVGASTGGFTDCLLQHGAKRVYAIDVGRAQLHDKLRQDPRVISHEGVNARQPLSKDVAPEPVDVMVIDVSFISLKLVLPSVITHLRSGGTLIALVKPQFEVGPEHVEKGGVVRDASIRTACIEDMTAFVSKLPMTIVGVIDSPIAGPAGNVEALLVATRG